MSYKEDIFDGVTSIISCVISLTGLIFTLIVTDFANPLSYIPALIFWGGWLIFSIMFVIKVYKNMKKRKQEYKLKEEKLEEINK